MNCDMVEINCVVILMPDGFFWHPADWQFEYWTSYHCFIIQCGLSKMV